MSFALEIPAAKQVLNPNVDVIAYGGKQKSPGSNDCHLVATYKTANANTMEIHANTMEIHVVTTILVYCRIYIFPEKFCIV